MAEGTAAALLIPAAITVVGWFIVSRQAEKREFRKEIRDRVSELRELGRDTHAAAVGYWLESSTKTAPSAAVHLKAEINRLARQTTILVSATLSLDEASLIQRVRQAATSGEFEKAARQHKATDPEIVTDTAAAIEELIMAVETAFYERFRPITNDRFPWFIAVVVALALVFSLRDGVLSSPKAPSLSKPVSPPPSDENDGGMPAPPSLSSRPSAKRDIQSPANSLAAPSNPSARPAD